MLQRWVLVGNAVTNILFGLGFLLAANAVLGLYGGMQMEPATDQLLGSALIGFALLDFFARDVSARDARRAIFLANVVYNALVLIVVAPAIAMGTNAIGWVTVAIAVVFTLGFAYLLLGTFRASQPIVAPAA